jgi:hypothetical protein
MRKYARKDTAKSATKVQKFVLRERLVAELAGPQRSSIATALIPGAP